MTALLATLGLSLALQAATHSAPCPRLEDGACWHPLVPSVVCPNGEVYAPVNHTPDETCRHFGAMDRPPDEDTAQPR